MKWQGRKNFWLMLVLGLSVAACATKNNVGKRLPQGKVPPVQDNADPSKEQSMFNLTWSNEVISQMRSDTGLNAANYRAQFIQYTDDGDQQTESVVISPGSPSDTSVPATKDIIISLEYIYLSSSQWELQATMDGGTKVKIGLMSTSSNGSTVESLCSGNYKDTCNFDKDENGKLAFFLY